MKWFKAVLMRILRGAIDQLVQEVLEKAASELSGEIDEAFKDTPEQRDAMKAGIVMLRAQTTAAINERLNSSG